jgi:hypothetical protein
MNELRQLLINLTIKLVEAKEINQETQQLYEKITMLQRTLELLNTSYQE